MQLTQYQIETANSFMERTPVICHNPRQHFIDLLVSYGFAPRQLKIGELDRIPAPDEGQRGTAGWYIYHEIDDTTEDGYVIGVADFGNWKTDLKEKWCSRSERQMNDKELRAYRIKRDIMRQQYEEEKRKVQNEAAAKAYSMWNGFAEATPDHPYLKAKGIGVAQGVKVTPQNDLIIPAQIENKITTLQSIKADGEYMVGDKPIGNKKFMAGGKSKGSYFPIRGKDDVVYIAEGYSTGMSVHMATDKFVYVCFNCHNIYNVAAYAKEQHPDALIIIAGDDDFKNEVNAGRKYAEEAARAHGAMAIYPAGLNDFNDLHLEQGLEAVKKVLLSDGRNRKHVVENGAKEEPDVLRPAGVLGHIFDYYNATSGMRQHGFAVQTAIASVGAMLSRNFRTTQNNYSPVYTINVGESGTGKENIKNTMEKILEACGYQDSICGDGFTSGGAVFSVLLDRPSAVTCIDELGRYLEASAANKGGNQHEANTKLMEIYSRADKILRPPNYSTMTLSKDAKKDLKSRYVYNPCLTILSMTTPSTLFRNLNIPAIEDGFATRFLIYISNAEPKAFRMPEPIEVPAIITEWAEKIRARTATKECVATIPADPIIIHIPEEVDDLSLEFKQYEIDLMKALKKYGIQKLPNRMRENALRLSMIHALSRDPNANAVTVQDFVWASEWVKNCMNGTIDALKMTVSRSEFEGDKKEILADIRQREGGITWAQMMKTQPYSKHKKQELKGILEALREAELVDFEAHNPAGRGRPTQLWFAVE